MMAAATQTGDQRHCRYCNEVVVNARPLSELQRRHYDITCKKCQYKRDIDSYKIKRGLNLGDRRFNIELKAPVIKEGYSEFLCSKCGSYRELRERNTAKYGIRLIAVCAPCSARRREDRRIELINSGKLKPIELVFNELDAYKQSAEYAAILKERKQRKIDRDREYAEMNREKRRAYANEYNKRRKLIKAANKTIRTEEEKREAKRLHRQQYRARMRGVLTERVERIKVFDRDDWKCYICGCEVIMSRIPVLNRATLDHVIPLVKGGSHTYDNIKTCCNSCNSKKSGNDLAVVVGRHGRAG